MRFRFDLDQEGNISTWFASSLLLLAAGILLAIASASRRRRAPSLPWFLLFLLFLLLSADEVSQLHEMLGGRSGSPGTMLLKHLGLVGNTYFYFDWILAVGLLVLGLAIICVPLLLYVPVRTALLLTAAAGFFVTGALGFEALSAAEVFVHGSSMVYHRIIVAEEAAEGAGTLLGIYALHTYLQALTDGKGHPAPEPGAVAWLLNRLRRLAKGSALGLED
jgi:hypothetical protein